LGLGHNHPEINKTIIEQLGKIAHAGYKYSTPIVEKASAKLLEIVDFPDGKCVFLSSGSEAVEYSI